MRQTYFEICNFKGIEHVRIDFNTQPRSNIYTLVGLNESGKTTILDALYFHSYKKETLQSLDLQSYSIKDVHELIPISKRSNFNDSIAIEAGYEFDDEDIASITNYVKQSLGIALTEKIEDLVIKRSYRFQNSRLVSGQPSSEWTITLIGKRDRAKRSKPLAGEDWKKATDYILDLLPSLLYFPNFLFEFPDKIYLEDVQGTTDRTKHIFYRGILQDVLDAIGDGTNLTTHILERAKEGSAVATQALEQTLLNMGRIITRDVFTSWNRIFKRNVGQKRIRVRVGKDEGPTGLYYVQLRLEDANELYTIGERSLGFRWFFAFLLLTQYRGARKGGSKNVLYLLDEPASNLHPSAQSQLLESFGNFPSNTSILYTTHSHHMINPRWLEGTFVVKNAGLDYDSSDDNYIAKNTVITLDKYRNFAAQHPDQSTYFQPVLDILDYSPSKLENIPDVVMVEGKNDFYTLMYFQDKVLGRSAKLNLIPGGGAGSLDGVIRLYVGWGRNFIVLLDSDDSGLEQKKRYENIFGVLVKSRIFSLQDVDASWKKKGMEYVVEESDRMSIQQSAYPTAQKFNKTHFNRSIQEAYLISKQISVTKVTTANMSKILDFCGDQLALNRGI